MSWRIVAANGAVLLGIAWTLPSWVRTEPTPVLPHAASESHTLSDIHPLEAAAARRPGGPKAVVDLASAYMMREQPGLAAAVVERAPDVVREDPEVGELYA